MRDVAIRPAVLSDLATLKHLIAAYHAWEGIADAPHLDDSISALLNGDTLGGFWLAFHGHEAVGYIAVTRSFSLAAGGDVLVVDELFITERARGLGLGRLLTSAVQSHGQRLGCRQLLLEVANGNRTAQAFYAALGFTPRLRRAWERPITTALQTAPQF